MAEYIDKEKLLNDIECIDVIGCMDFDDLFIEVERIIKDQPTADVEEVKHSKWKKIQNYALCSNCKHEVNWGSKDFLSPYCPNCGAKMDKECKQPMKRGIEIHSDYDRSGRWHLIIEKKKGKLSLDEIKECA